MSAAQLFEPDRFADWRRMAAHEAAVRAAGGCTCCASIVGRPIGRRICWWHCGSGHVEALCLDCYDAWAANAREDPDLAPKYVEFDAAEAKGG